MAEVETKPVPRTRIVKIAVWVNCGLLVVGGFFSVISGILLAVFQPTVFVMSVYMFLFGIIAFLGELNVGIARRYFGFLHDWIGEAVFFVFVGTLGIGQGTGSLFAFIVGIVSCVVGVACLLDHFMCTKKLFFAQTNAPGPAGATAVTTTAV